MKTQEAMLQQSTMISGQVKID